MATVSTQPARPVPNNDVASPRYRRDVGDHDGVGNSKVEGKEMTPNAKLKELYAKARAERPFLPVVEIISNDGEVVKEIRCERPSQVERMEDDVNIDLDHDNYYTRIVRNGWEEKDAG
jgi:hypothetical protein